MKKKYLTLALLLTFTLSLSACKTNENDTNTNNVPVDGGSDVDESITYIVNFNSNGGTAVSSQEVYSGGKLQKPSDPSKTSDNPNIVYSFEGWYKDAGLTQPFNFETETVTTAFTLYAKWNSTTVSNKCTVAFNTDGGSTINSIEVDLGSTISKPSDPTKQSSGYINYTFVGWYKDSNKTQEFNFTTDTINGNTTLYAKWTASYTKFEVTYYNGDNKLSSEQVTAEGTITYQAPTITGFTFEGWFTDKGFTKAFAATTPVTGNLTLYAKYKDNSQASSSLHVDSYSGFDEGIYLNIDLIPNLTASDYKVYYYSADLGSYKQLDSELVRLGSKVRADIVGLKPGDYSVRVEAANQTVNITNITVTAADRSGYAHFNYTSGVGAYKDDGTLKNNAVVVYVNESNKNTVTATINGSTYTGLSNILKNATNANYPVDVRILGTIGAATWNPLSVNNYYDSETKKGVNPETAVKGANNQYLPLQSFSEDDIISAGYNTLNTSEYSKLNGLTNKIKYDSSKLEFDSYYNMLDISGAKNVTVEGIGEDAELFQWGFTWKYSNSIEVKNLTFDDYTEDACSFEGANDSNTLSGFNSKNYWIHNNTFNRGINYWDVCSEQDKHDGDGATDFKKCAYVTLSYNHYYNNHKTGLIGGSDTQTTAAITFHHNFYDRCQARLPFARQANMHMYNNYYYGTTGNNMQIYAGAYAYIENCYFDSINTTFIVRENTSGTGTPAIKSYNNIFQSAASTGATIVTNRNAKVANENKYGQNFDTDSSIFYFDEENSRSNVSFMMSAENVKTYVPQYAGAGKLTSVDYSLNLNESNGQYEETTSKATYSYSASAPTVAGLYYTVLDNQDQQQPLPEASVTEATIVTQDDGKIYITDTSAEATTIGYYMFEDAKKYTSGTHTYSTTVTLGAVGSNWAFIRLLDENGVECLTVGAASETKYMIYTYNGETVTVKETAFAANKTYTVSLTVNYDNDTASITIDGTTVQISSFTTSSISGIKYFTAKKAADRSFVVTNIEVN